MQTRKLSLILIFFLFLSLFSGLVFAVSIPFSDGFESGNFTAWTGTNGSPTVTDTQKHTGTYSMLCDATAEYAYADYSGQTTVYNRIYFRISVLPSTNGVTGYLIRLRNTSTYVADLLLYRTGGKNYLRFLRYFPGSSGTNYDIDATLAADTWYCLEVKVLVHASAGEYRVYFQGSEVITQTGLDTSGATSIITTRTGAVVFDWATNVYIDCVKIETSYIGTEPTGQNLTFTLSQVIHLYGTSTMLSNVAKNLAFIFYQNVKFWSFESMASTKIQKVQGFKKGNTMDTDTCNVTLDSNPTSGNFMVATISIQSDAAPKPQVSSIVGAGVSSWTKQVNVTDNGPSYHDMEIWAGIVDTTLSRNITVTITYGGSFVDTVVHAAEYSGVASSNFLDKTATNAFSYILANTTRQTGTTATTTVNNELWIGAMMSNGDADDTLDTPQNGFTLFDGIYSPRILATLEKIVSSTGAAYSGVTNRVDDEGRTLGGCIATFKATGGGLNLNFVLSIIPHFLPAFTMNKELRFTPTGSIKLISSIISNLGKQSTFTLSIIQSFITNLTKKMELGLSFSEVPNIMVSLAKQFELSFVEFILTEVPIFTATLGFLAETGMTTSDLANGAIALALIALIFALCGIGLAVKKAND